MATFIQTTSLISLPLKCHEHENIIQDIYREVKCGVNKQKCYGACWNHATACQLTHYPTYFTVSSGAKWLTT
jgi:hypothetical protein